MIKCIPLLERDKYKEALQVLGELVEKERLNKPKKPTENYHPNWLEDLVGIKARYTCPSCGNDELVDENLDISFCWKCGQKLEWGCKGEEN